MPRAVHRRRRPAARDEFAKREFNRSKALRIVAVVAILIVASWFVIGLLSPAPRYRLTQTPAVSITSNEFLRELEAMTASRVAHGVSVEPLPNGDVFYQAELQAIRAARSSINWEAYIFHRGEIATQVIAALAERARAGVQVRVVMDGLGSASTTMHYLQPLRDAGGKAAFYHPLRWKTWVRSNNRTHRELLVIDGETAFVGGAGVGDQWFKGTSKEPPWRDEMFRVRGEAVRAVQGTFLENWLEASGELLAGEQFFPPEPQAGTATALVVFSSPSQGGSTRGRVLMQTLLASAQKSIQITTPYFLPDETLQDTMLAARKRGVSIRILVPGTKTDHALTRDLSRSGYGPLLKAGAEIFEYLPTMIHAKIMVIDEVWSVVGSTNFDHRSFGLNDEINLAVLDPALAATLTGQFDGDVGQAEHITVERWQRRSLWERGMAWVAWVFERQQ